MIPGEIFLWEQPDKNNPPVKRGERVAGALEGASYCRNGHILSKGIIYLPLCGRCSSRAASKQGSDLSV